MIHNVYFLKTNWIIVSEEIIAVYSQNHMKRTNTLHISVSTVIMATRPRSCVWTSDRDKIFSHFL
jgi:hypothetical protein